MYGVFATAAQANPSMLQGVVGAADPAEAAYQMGMQLHLMSQVGEAGGLDGLREKLKAEILAEQGQTAEAQAAEAAISAAIPKPLGTRRSVGGGNKPEEAWSGPTPLGDMVG